MAMTLPMGNDDTLHGMFWSRVAGRAGKVVMRQKELGIWRSWKWDEVGTIVREISCGLIAIGVNTGECVSILANTRVEWVWCDLAVLSAGGVSNGIYPTDGAPHVQTVCADSGTVVLVVEDEEQLDKALSVRANLPLLCKIVLLDPAGTSHFSDPMVMTLDELRRVGAARDKSHPGEFERRCALRGADDLAVLIYTSGTTGLPLGAMHSHRNLLTVLGGLADALPRDERDERMCFLPMCHATERVAGVYEALYSGTKMNFVENPDTVAENVREIAPTLLEGMPRMWEKFYSAVTIAVSEAGPVQQKLYAWAMRVGAERAGRLLEGRPVDAWLRLRYRLAGFASLDNVRRFIGIHRSRALVTCGAPISPELVRWYLGLGIPMLEAWGQTESAGISTLMHPASIRLGSVGKPCAHNEVRADAITGELLVRGSNVFMGYLNQPARTAQVMDAAGWLHTGDVGSVDGQGHVRITDRMQDVITTAEGTSVTPSELENELKVSPYVTDALVIGDGRPYLSAMVLLEHENVEKYAHDHDVAFSGYAGLARSPEVIALIEAEIARVNQRLGGDHRIRKFFLLDTQLGAGDEEMTPTIKLKRRVVLHKYADRIEALYAADADPAAAAHIIGRCWISG